MDKHIGAQYYTIRDSIQNIEDFEKSCKKISEIGYKIVQISGTPLKAKDMRPILDEYGLKVVTSHRGFTDFMKNIDEIIDYNKTLGSDLCGVGIMPIEYGADRQKLEEFIRESQKVCEALKQENLYFGYHNHAFEFAKLDGKTILDYLIEGTDPEVFNFIVDTYWVQVGGKNPAKVIESLGKRAMAIHFKDFRVDKENWTVPTMAEVGEGNLDWDDIIAACEKAGSRWALVEQDGNWLHDPFESLKMSYDYLTTKGFC